MNIDSENPRLEIDDVEELELQLKDLSDKLHCLDLTRDGVISKLHEQDPTIKSIYTHFECPADQFDWESAGRIIGNSHHVKYLSLSVPRTDLYHDGVSLFCQGMSLNRSVEFFRVSVLGANVDSDDFFQSLHLFFQYNADLKYLDIHYVGSHWGMIKALGASESSNLKAVSLSRYWIRQVNSHFEDELIRAITSRHPLCQISLDHNAFTENSADDISAMLANSQCKLKSLALCDINPSIMDCIARGLDNNASIKYLKCSGDQAHLLLEFKTPNNTLENLELSGADWNLRTSHRATQLKSLLALKSLNLSQNDMSSHRVLSHIFHAVLAPSSKLEELVPPRLLTDSSLKILGECIVANALLKSLDVSNNTTLTADGWKSFFHQLRKSSFRERAESITLSYIQINDDMLEELLQLFVNITTLSVLNLTECSISSEGWRSLLEVLHRTSLEKLVGIALCDFTDETLTKLHQLFDNGNFKVAVFGEILQPRSRFVQAAVEFLTGQSCRVEELTFELCKFDGQQDLTQTTSAWIESLSRNATLQSLSVKYNVSWRNSGFGFWPEYHRLLCNTETINATHSSNHMLQSLKFECVYDLDDDSEDEEGWDGFALEVANMPIAIYSMLQLNRGTNKAAVARRKVMRVHFSGLSGRQKLNDLNFGSKMMPRLLSWIGKERTEFSIMYNFLHDNPSLLDAGVEQTRKRKMC